MERILRLKAPQEFQYGKILVISPHSDDAAYSIGGLIQKSIFTSQIHIITLFGRSNFLRKSGFERDWRSVTSVRKREDETFAARIGAELTYLDFPEAGIRIGPGWEEIFAQHAASTTPVPQKLWTRVSRLLDRLRPGCLVAPLGIGRHCDHLIAQQIAATEARHRNLPLSYYEDLPYAADLTTTALVAHVKSVDPKLRPKCIPIDLAAKLNNLTLYRSQLGDAQMQVVAEYAQRLPEKQPAERIWSSASQLECLRILQTSRLTSELRGSTHATGT